MSMCEAWVCVGHEYVWGMSMCEAWVFGYVWGIGMCGEWVFVEHEYVWGMCMCAAWLCVGHGRCFRCKFLDACNMFFSS